MWSWLSRFFPSRTLDGVGEGSYCHLRAKVVSADSISSTIAPTRSAVIRWTLLYEHTEQQSRGGGYTRPLFAFAKGWRGGPLVVRAECGRTIEIALDGARLVAPVDPDDGTPLGSSPASASTYGELAGRAPLGAGPVYVREHAITSGQSIVVRAWIEPVAKSGGYRDAAVISPVQFRALRDVTLEDPLTT